MLEASLTIGCRIYFVGIRGDDCSYYRGLLEKALEEMALFFPCKRLRNTRKSCRTTIHRCVAASPLERSFTPLFRPVNRKREER